MTTRRDPEPTFGAPSVDAAVFVISVAAELTGLHPQTLRTYERLGLVSPGRTPGGGRRYSPRDIERLRHISALTGAGIGTEGVRRILELEEQVAALAAHNEDLAAEVTALREALRQLGAARRAASSGQPPTTSSGDRLPVLRRSAPGQAVVVWRRGH